MAQGDQGDFLQAARALSPSRMWALARTIIAAADDDTKTQRSALVAIIVRASAAGLAYILQVFLAQVLGAHEFGLYAYAWIWVMIGGRMGPVGMGQSAVRFIAEYRDSNQFDLLRGYIASSWVIVWIGSIALTAIGLAGLYLFEDLVATPYVMPLYLAVICIPLFALQGLMEGHALGWSWTGLAQAPAYLLRQGLIIIVVGTAILAGWPATAVTAMSAVIIASALSTLFQYTILRRRIGQEIAAGDRQRRMGYWLKSALPLFLMDSFQMALTFVDILILGFYVEPAIVAVYFAATRITMLISLVQLAVAAAAGQRFAGIAASQGSAKVAELVRKTLHWTFWPSLLVAIGIIASGWLLLRLFGAEFTSAYPLLPVLAIGVLARASVGPAENLLIMLGHERATLIAQVIGSVTNVALNLSLIPTMGIYGAAIATSISMVMFSAALEVYVRRRIGISCWVATA